MDHYNYTHVLESLWHKAVHLYEGGNRNAQSYFSADEVAFLESIGATAQEIYDFAEDFVGDKQPDLPTFAQIQGLRYDYFYNVQHGQPSERTIPIDELPPKDAAFKDIEWLPRIIAKAHAKLRGEMSADYMYGCGGDRKFCRTHNIHPAEFLAFVSRNMGDDDAIAAFVKDRSPEFPA